MKVRIVSGIIGILCSTLFVPAAKAGFSDVSPYHPYAEAIQFVEDRGIAGGYPDGTFRPDQTINRAELTKIIVGAAYESILNAACVSQYLSPNDENIFFPDVFRGDWFSSFICMAKVMNVVNGYPDGTFQPANEVNFVEAAKIIVLAFGFEVGENRIWYMPYIEKLEELNAVPGTISGYDAKLTRGEMAYIIMMILKEIERDSGGIDDEEEPDGGEEFPPVLENEELLAEGTFSPVLQSSAGGRGALTRDGIEYFFVLRDDFLSDDCPSGLQAYFGYKGFDPKAKITDVKNSSGYQKYPVPISIDASQYTEIWLYCKDFGGAFARATMQ